jgi:hypothetical protein
MRILFITAVSAVLCCTLYAQTAQSKPEQLQTPSVLQEAAAVLPPGPQNETQPEQEHDTPHNWLRFGAGGAFMLVLAGGVYFLSKYQ